MAAAAAAVLNSIKYLSEIPDALPIITEQVLSSVRELKTEILDKDRSSLTLEEILLALTVSGTQNPTAEYAKGKLLELNGCRAHCTAILSDRDEQTLQTLGIDVTSDPEYVTTNLYTG